MRSAIVAAAAFAAGASAVTLIPGTEVPLIYADKPYPDPPYLGTQYNATVINGIPYNASNEWPCLTAANYFTIPPACAKECLIGTFKNATLCANDDFYCHCQPDGSAELDKYIIPCLTAADSPCTGEEIGELANFVHGALCPYFMALTYEEEYGHCDGSWGASTVAPTSTKGGYGGSWTTSTSSAKTTDECVTSTQTSWTKECEGPTTFWVGTKTWTVTKATTITVTDCPITWTKPVSTGTWAPIEWTTAAPASSAWAAPVATTPAAAAYGWATTSAAKVSTTAAWGAPAEFTGAASNNKVAGAMAAVAAGAALLL